MIFRAASRIRWLLSRCDIGELIGMSDRSHMSGGRFRGRLHDPITQSLIGLILIWVLIVFGARENRLEQVRYTNAICIYFSLAMMVSYSVFTIKTARCFGLCKASCRGGGISRRRLGSRAC